MRTLSLIDALKLPPPFMDARDERAFRRRFLIGGIRLSRVATLIGSTLSFAFWVVLVILVPENAYFSERQIIRFSISITLASCAAVLYLYPGFAVRKYTFVLGVPTSLVCVGIGFMGILPADLEHQTTTRLATAMTVACWLMYGFTRLPTLLVTLACVIASVVTVFGAMVHRDEYLTALILYLLVANLIGWAMSVGTERRERALFVSSRKLMELSKSLSISARENAEANIAKSHVLAAVSHDLSQPVTSMALYLDSLESMEGDASPSKRAIALSQIRECVSVMMGNLSRLSNIADLQRRDACLPVSEIDLRKTFLRLQSIFGGQADQKGVRFVSRIPREGAFRVISNEDRLWDVAVNLVGNALKYCDPERSAWVLVRAVRVHGFVRITVRDNGIGIEEEFQRRVFDEYFQVGNPGRDRNKGYGLGLSIVRETLSRLPGHHLKLLSSPRRGTRFDIWVPTAPASSGEVSDVALTGASRVSTKDSDLDPLVGCYVLVVEDDLLVRSALVETMENWGMLVDVAGSYDEALDVVRRAERMFDIVVSDFSLPGENDGLRVIDAIRDEQDQPVPAIIMSARVEAIDSGRLSQVGARAMSKPLDVAHLRAELEACVAA